MNRIHVYKQGAPGRPTLLLLHGTGGSETDLLEIAAHIDVSATIISVRGEVNENGWTRHFKRIGPFTFDQLDLTKRTIDLEKFIEWASSHYGFDRKNIIGLGYSNGANLLSSHMFNFPHSIKGAILLHPMSGGVIEKMPDLLNVPIFIGAGTNDTICPSDMTHDLHHKFVTAGADVTLSWHDFGHSISAQELQKATAWYLRHFDK